MVGVCDVQKWAYDVLEFTFRLSGLVDHYRKFFVMAIGASMSHQEREARE